MIRRAFYLALGATVGVLVVKQARKTASSLTPGAIGGAAAGGVKAFFAEVQAGMAEREAELRAALGLDDRPTDPAA